MILATDDHESAVASPVAISAAPYLREKMKYFHRFIVVFAFTAGLFLTVGCGSQADHGIDLNPVRGSVLQNGVPVEGVSIAIYPIDMSQWKAGVPIPKGKTDASGKFALRTFDPDDGAPAGEYGVTIRFFKEFENTAGEIDEYDQLKGAYADPSKPFTTITISQNTTLEPFVLP